MYSPKTANTTAKICTLKRDNLTVGDHWCLVGDDTVTICRQKTGTSAEAEITMTKRDFNRIVKFYTTPTKDPTHDRA
jgi:hypothetical protein